MYFLQKFMTGESIEKKLTDYINMKKESAELKASFIIFEDNIMYDVDYNICIVREKDNFAVIKKDFPAICSKYIRTIWFFCHFFCENGIKNIKIKKYW